MINDLPQELTDRLTKLGEKYARRLQGQVTKALENYTATGDLIRSISVKLVTGEQPWPEIHMTYSDPGDYLNKRKMLFTKVPPIDDLKEWAESKNISLNNIPGYTAGSLSQLSDDQKRERIAWAIGVDKRMNDTWKRRNWKRKPVSELLKELNQEIIEAYRSEIEKEIASFISNE